MIEIMAALCLILIEIKEVHEMLRILFTPFVMIYVVMEKIADFIKTLLGRGADIFMRIGELIETFILDMFD